MNLLPIVGVASAVLLLEEELFPIQALGGALVRLGVWLTTAHSGLRIWERGIRE